MTVIKIMIKTLTNVHKLQMQRKEEKSWLCKIVWWIVHQNAPFSGAKFKKCPIPRPTPFDSCRRSIAHHQLSLLHFFLTIFKHCQPLSSSWFPSPYDLYCVGGTLSLTQSINQSQLSWIRFVVKRSVVKLFSTNYMQVIERCRDAATIYQVSVWHAVQYW